MRMCLGVTQYGLEDTLISFYLLLYILKQDSAVLQKQGMALLAPYHPNSKADSGPQHRHLGDFWQ